MLIQESKFYCMSDSIVKAVCGSASFDWVWLDAEGSSGDILLCCNRRVLSIKDERVGSFSMSALVDLSNNSPWIVTSVYGPNDRSLRGNFWSELDNIHSRWIHPWCIGGDWNVIRFPTEKSCGDHISPDTSLLGLD